VLADDRKRPGFKSYRTIARVKTFRDDPCMLNNFELLYPASRNILTEKDTERISKNARFYEIYRDRVDDRVTQNKTRFYVTFHESLMIPNCCISRDKTYWPSIVE